LLGQLFGERRMHGATWWPIITLADWESHPLLMPNMAERICERRRVA
jgi:hypothetical protein